MLFDGKDGEANERCSLASDVKCISLNRRCDQNDLYLVKQVQSNIYNELTNPNGIVNLGVAFSFICDDIIKDKLKKVKLESAHLDPANGVGSFHHSLVEFYTRELAPNHPLDANKLVITNGLNATLDILAHIIADPGDVFCTPTPTYSYFIRNFFIRSGVELSPIDLLNSHDNCLEKRFELTAKIVEDGIEMAIQQGKTVRAFVLTNPSNPLGNVYPERLVLEIMEVCAKFKIHVIIDECNNFCILKDGVRFKSVVAFDHIPDPNRTHVLWTFTKDFSAVGARIAAIYSFSPEVLDSFKVIKPFCATSVFSHNVCQEMIDDRHWCQEIYFPSIIDRLRDCYQLLEDRLNKIGAIVYPVEGGFTALVSFQKFLRSNTFEEEIELLHQFLKCGVYVVPGQFIWCSQPGWFRIAFSHPKTFVQLGLERIEEALVHYGGPLP